MPDSEQRKNGDALDAEYELVQSSPEDAPGIATYRSLARLLIGAALEGGDELLRRIRAWEEEHPQAEAGTLATEEETAAEQLRYALIGFLFEAPETAARGVMRTAKMAESVGRAGEQVFGPLVRSRLFGPVRRRGQRMQARVELTVERWMDIGRSEEPTGRAMVQELTPQLIDDVVAAFADNEAIQELIRTQAGDYLAYLQDEPEELDGVVQSVGDRYVKYLHDENPDDVQDLIAGQTLGLTTEIADELRERTVTADSVVEMFVRSLLRRPPRQDLPAPPSEVKLQALRKPIQQRKQLMEEEASHD
ncbi:MAG TPA: hypothetical protein G4N94_08490 [Caldilineae bacterium]|nr:hypothetical protein [Caldilineae bacterium]